LEPGGRPAGVASIEQWFWRTAFHHFSLLFLPRPPSQPISTPTTTSLPRPSTTSHPGSVPTDPLTLLQRHVELCKQVLKVMTMAGRTCGGEFDTETWEVILKVVLGICDFLLKEPVIHPTLSSLGTSLKDKDGNTITTTAPSTTTTTATTSNSGNSNLAVNEISSGFKRYSSNPAPPPPSILQPMIPGKGEEASWMASELAEHLIRVLFELWIRSKTKNTAMWDHLKRGFVRWTHRVEIVHQWNATCFGLTQRVIRILWGGGPGAPTSGGALGGSVVISV